ncbi:hydroxysqualene dehydroxylase HpnE [Vineibacter terrae]|uniref:hydroxysqualene dehydroxylase HpnE n=1 Tax=Vineibacter terrae TaxID=2586908 RepID=UPI002E33D69B|nr:hydroxysqualene dehydroxylase HpnE [Vineibacter terrae]HEX2892265.1 hydroxysqualene dehydroxylase HpnE [Vineibacter terrae]
MTQGTVYVIGAGLAGLAAAVAAARGGARVVLMESAEQAGGRCRSYRDAALGHVIDNGNHLVLSGNHATQAYLRTIGAADRLAGPDRARFAFIDMRDGARWTIAPNDGRLPWWVLARSRRVPGSALGEYLALTRLRAPPRGSRIADVIACSGPFWDKLLRPFLLAALNTEPETASAELAASVIRETLLLGGRACRPRIATPSLDAAFIAPALAYLEARGASVRFGQRLRGVGLASGRATTLDFVGGPVALAAADRVVLATPPWVTHDLLPDIAVPDDFRAIVNAHFSIAPPPGVPPMTGVIGGTAEWVFAFHDRLSVTVSCADRLVDCGREALAKRLWHDVATVCGLGPTLPPWQIVKERRATFAATPAQAARRAAARTAWANLVLAGDWTDTGLPATIEGAVRSGQQAAALVLRA